MTLPRNSLNIFSIVMKNITVGVKKTWFETGLSRDFEETFQSLVVLGTRSH